MDRKTVLPQLPWVAFGGMTGAMLRHGINTGVTSLFGDSYIYLATAFENVAGSGMMGFLFVWLASRYPENRALNSFLLVGLIGSYTTYSGFGTQSYILIQNAPALFAFYFFGQIFLGLIALAVGMKVASGITSRSS
ncbi:MAG: CrcB family protein [Balneolaceae bacterium]|nr:CrcB family protein [Balneolaceae bacterium]MCH8549443.1 CrcB family protein [Balneolaceae bacterium]